MGQSGRTLGISLAGALALSLAGCYKLSSDCALNLCDPPESGLTTSSEGGTSSSSETGGNGGESTSSSDGATGGAGGTTSSAGGTTDTTPQPSCDPAVNVGPVADDCGVFVSGSGSDAGDGSKASPLMTLKAALALAANGKRRVYACAGTFEEAVELSEGVTFYGGLDCENGFSYNGLSRTEITAPAGEIPMKLGGGSEPIAVFDVTVQAEDAVLPGQSSVAVLAVGVVATFTRCDFLAGNGMDGSLGVSGGDPAAQAGSGSPGATACGNKANPPFPPISGAAAGNSCDGVTLLAGQGGFGGVAANGTGADGDPGDFGAGGPGGGGDKAPPACTAGGAGLAGSHGSPGLGGGGDKAMPGTLDVSGFHGWDGEPGQTGTHGASGGGGGGSRAGLTCNGASGGSGGAGGCRGNPGLGGAAGGSSVAVVSIGSVLDFQKAHLTVGSGGKGGNGGDGQFGQLGGGGGNGGMASGGVSGGCSGGPGGDGGNGGPGGGGQGGFAFGIAYSGAAPTGSPAVLFTGEGGLGGLGGTNGVEMGGDGAPGQALEIQSF